MGDVCDASLNGLAWFEKLDANSGLLLDHVGFEQRALFYFEYAVFVLKSVMLTSKVDPLPYVLTGFVLPRLWLF